MHMRTQWRCHDMMTTTTTAAAATFADNAVSFTRKTEQLVKRVLGKSTYHSAAFSEIVLRYREQTQLILLHRLHRFREHQQHRTDILRSYSASLYLISKTWARLLFVVITNHQRCSPMLPTMASTKKHRSQSIIIRAEIVRIVLLCGHHRGEHKINEHNTTQHHCALHRLKERY